MEGKQAVQVASAKAPSTGSRIWQDISNLLFGQAEQDNSADALSLFWQSGD